MGGAIHPLITTKIQKNMIDNYRKAADENLLKPVSQLQVNDFMLTINVAFNPYDLLDAVRICTNGGNVMQLVKIVDILYVTNEQFNQLTFAFTNEGGTDDFFNLVTLVICDDKHYYFDAQGYTYIRYLHFPLAWMEMYASEIKRNQQKELQIFSFARELILSCAEMHKNVGCCQLYGDTFTTELERIATKLNIDHSEIKVIIGLLHIKCDTLQFSISDDSDFISVTLTKTIKK